MVPEIIAATMFLARKVTLFDKLTQVAVGGKKMIVLSAERHSKVGAETSKRLRADPLSSELPTDKF